MVKRRLRPDEAELWSNVARTVDPLHPAARIAPVAERPAPGAPPPRKVQPPAAGPQKSTPPPAHPIAPRDHRRIGKGRTAIDARLDLHGLRQDEAFGRLQGFLVQARQRGHRHVLVITGTGRPDALRSPDPDIDVLEERAARRGVLHRMVPHWLSTAPLRVHVAAWSPAARHHGGDGALYIRLSS